MKLEQNHIIDKVYLDVNTKDVNQANSIKNNINLFMQNQLFPQLEELFNEYDNANEIIRFDSVNINFSIDNWENEEAIKLAFKSKIISKLKEELEHRKSEKNLAEINTQNVESISSEENNENTFLFFLENGFLPWFGKEEYIVEFITQEEFWISELNNEVFLLKLKDILSRNNTIIQRFVLQFQNEIVVSFLEKINAENTNFKKDLLVLLNVLDKNTKNMFLEFFIQISLFDDKEKWIATLQNILKVISENKKPLNEKAGFHFLNKFKKIVQKIAKVMGDEDLDLFDSKIDLSILKDTLPTLKNEKNDHLFFEQKTSEIAIKNAGLIIIHPFINSFFKNLDFLDSTGSIKIDLIELAVQSLHFIGTGNNDFFEGNLILEKFLCGIPLKMPNQKESLLNDKIKDEANALLSELIKNWSELKNTSPNGLREMFFYRDGKLIQNENEFKIIIERKAQDVLIEKLPWNISVVKLPWKKELLFIDW